MVQDGSTAAAQASAFGEPMFAIIYCVGPNWLEGKPLREQPFQSHNAYLRSLFERGRLAFAGVDLGEEFTGIAYVRAPDQQEAEAIMREDPAVKGGLFSARVSPWLTVFQQSPPSSGS